MKKLLAFFALFGVSCLLHSAPAAESVKWGGSFAAAEQTAKAEKKNILLLFTAPGWCGPCRALEKGALSSAKFAAFAKGCVLVRLDFSDRTKVTKEMNDAARRFKLEGFPTVILLTPAGKEAGRIVGSRPEKAFVDELTRIAGKGK